MTPGAGAATPDGGALFSSMPVSPSRAAGRTGRGVTRDEIRSARAAPLYDYVMARHGGRFRKTGSCLYLADRDGVYIRDGFPGYNDFSTGSHGNPIDFLVSYLGYGFVDAVVSLNSFRPQGSPGMAGGAAPPEERWNGRGGAAGHADSRSRIVLPEAAPMPFLEMRAYLGRRGIPPWLIDWLERTGLAYQDRVHNNIVFVNREKDYCELRGTLPHAGKPFHGCRKTGPDRFWYMYRNTRRLDRAYVCEAAIDAISLYLIHSKTGDADSSLYVSIGGAFNQKAIRRVNGFLPATLAVDNDRAGEECRKRNPDLPYIIPVNKDWNDDLLCKNVNNDI